MPNITVQWYAGRTDQQKREIVAAITDAMVRIGKTTADQVHIVFQDVEKVNWGANANLPTSRSPASARGVAPDPPHRHGGRAPLPLRPQGGDARRGPGLRLGVDGGAPLGDRPRLAL